MKPTSQQTAIISPQKADKVTPLIQAAGVELDFRRMQLPEDLLQQYSSQLERATNEMKAIEAGEKVNSDENRQVGHYWLRNPQIAPAEFRDDIQHVWQQLADFVTTPELNQFENILWIGIGGSGLGPQLIYDALRVPGQLPRMFFFDNTDPFGFQRTLDDIRHSGGLQSTLTVVVSKSGGTKETANGLKVAALEYERAGLSFARHAAAVTQPGSALDKQARPADGEQWLGSFAIWDWVGGRTSLFSAVGLLPIHLLKLDAERFLSGAREFDEVTRASSASENPALLLAAAWFDAVETRQLRNMVVLPYCDRVSMIAKYLQQLVMESVGKEGKGISVFGNKGSTDQHSYVQQLRDGYPDFFAVFLRVLDSGADAWEVEPGITAGDYLMAFQEGTARALSETGRPSMRITVDRFDEYTLGSLVALFERAVGYYGAMLGINSYHQPGVEAGKTAASEILLAQTAIVKHLPASAATVLSDARVLGELTATINHAEQLELLPEFVADVIHRLSVAGRIPS